MMPFVAVVMVTYNQEAYIREAIESVMMQQTSFSVKLCIAEDCSGDNTRNICIEYQEKYPDKIKLFLNEKNLGPGLNVYQLYEACFSSDAKYIAILDGDDYWTDSTKLQQQVDFLESNPDFNICFHEVKINMNGELIKNEIIHVPREVTTIEDLLINNFIPSCSVVFCNKIKKIPAWLKNAMPGDWALMLLAAGSRGKIKFMNKIMAVYRVHSEGTWSMQKRDKYVLSRMDTFYYCMMEFNLSDSGLPNKILLSAADSIYLYGFKFIPFSRYIFYLVKVFRKSSLSFRQKLFVFTAYFRFLFKLKKTDSR